MLTHPTLHQMNALGLAGMATAYRELIEQAHGNDLSFYARSRDRRKNRPTADKQARYSKASFCQCLDRRHRFWISPRS